MKSVCSRRSLDQATNPPSDADRPSSELTDDAQREVDRIESVMATMFDDAFITRDQCDDDLASVAASALPSALRDEGWYRQEIDRLQREIDQYRRQNRRLVIEIGILREECKKYPMLDDPLLLQLDSRLTDNDRDILTAMYELGATKAKPDSAENIVKTALATCDHKSGFKRLKKENLVGTAKGRGGGVWLTPRGRHVAIALIPCKP